MFDWPLGGSTLQKMSDEYCRYSNVRKGTKYAFVEHSEKQFEPPFNVKVCLNSRPRKLKDTCLIAVQSHLCDQLHHQSRHAETF